MSALLNNYYIVALIKILIVVTILMHVLAYLQWVERKVIAHVQVRPGPYNVGWHGLLQPLADVLKLITKEDMMPPYASTFLYLLAPFLAVFMALLSIAVIPFGPTIDVAGHRTWMQLTDLNVGVLYILAVSSMGVYGVALAGWASNNKYALIGGLRSSAQMISYELPMSLAIASPLLLSNSLSLRQIVNSQAGSIIHWNILRGPFPQIFAFILFLIAAFAETNRVPFDLPEAENELVAGFHTEYSSMKFASFFMAEYANMVTVSCMATILFLGGWMPLWPARYGSNYVPGAIFLLSALALFYHAATAARARDKKSYSVFGVLFLICAAIFALPVVQSWLIPLFWFCAKTGAILFAFMWIRATLPRFRYDQLMGFAWKFMFPVAMVNLLITGLLVALFP
jgi:NADH-quinone oxidoreductase subunit H